MLNPDLVGRTFTSADSVTVTKEAIQKFAEVIGENNIEVHTNYLTSVLNILNNHKIYYNIIDSKTINLKEEVLNKENIKTETLTTLNNQFNSKKLFFSVINQAKSFFKKI